MLSHADKLVLFCVFYQRGSPVGCRRALLREGYPNNSSVAIMAGWPEWAPGRFLCTEAELQMPSYPHCITGNGFPQENPTDVFPISFYLDWWRSCIASPWTPLTLYHNLSSAPVAPEISLTVCKTDPAVGEKQLQWWWRAWPEGLACVFFLILCQACLDTRWLRARPLFSWWCTSVQWLTQQG